MEHLRSRQHVVEMCRTLLERGYLKATEGNASVRVPGHLGLFAMRQRAQLAGGWCHIESEPGAGAKVEFWVPNSL